MAGTSLVALLLVGCAAPDAPQALRTTLPAEVTTLLRPDTVRRVELHPDVRYRYLWSPVGPWAVHLVEAPAVGRCEVGLDVLQSAPRLEGRSGRETVSSMADRAGPRVLAAVNADFFTPEGAPVGTEVVDARVTHRGVRPVVAWRPGVPPWMGMAEARDGAVTPPWDVGPLGVPAQEVVGGFPDLIDGGRRVGDLEIGSRPSFAAARHPRTAVGYDADDGRLWLVVVDGRQAPHSAGMTLPELAALLEALGVEEALNLDGGGSTTMTLGHVVVNRPSDATGERSVANALAVVRVPDGCPYR